MLEPLLRRPIDRTCILALHRISVIVGAQSMGSAYAEDVCIFVSCHSNIAVVHKALERYQIITGTKINRNNFSGLLLDAWKGVAFLGPFSWIN